MNLAPPPTNRATSIAAVVWYSITRVISFFWPVDYGRPRSIRSFWLRQSRSNSAQSGHFLLRLIVFRGIISISRGSSPAVA